MPLYEIVLRFPNHDELRLTDHDPGLEGEVRVDGRPWVVVAEEDRVAYADALKRYVVAPGRLPPFHTGRRGLGTPRAKVPARTGPFRSGECWQRRGQHPARWG